MIDPYVELGGWIIAQAIDDVLGCGEVTEEEQMDAWNFLLHNPVIEHILDHIDYGDTDTMSKQKFILEMVIPQRAFQVFLLNSVSKEINYPPQLQSELSV